MTIPHNRYRDRMCFMVDTLLDFDRKRLPHSLVRRAFGGSEPDVDVLIYATFAMINDVAGSALNKITLHHDMEKRQWRTNVDGMAYIYAANIVDDWRAHGAGTDTSLYDYVIFCINMLEDISKDVPTYAFHPKHDMVMRDGRLIPKVLDIDGVVLLPVP